MYTGKQLKELIDNHISDDDIVCFGIKGDVLGRYDRQIFGVEKRQIGFEKDDLTYKVIITEAYDSIGTMKFW